MSKRIITLVILVVLVLAVLSSCTDTHTNVVTFNTNGGSEIQDITIDGSFELPENPTKADFKFAGWYLDEALTKAYENAPTESCTLYAKWISLKWTLTLDANEGAVSETSKTVIIDSAYTLPVATRAGFYFVGWFDAETGGTKYANEAGESVANWVEYANKTLYAQYSEVPVVSFETNCEMTIADRYADADFTMPADPTRDGYTFLGWYTENNTDNQFVFTSASAITQSMTLYAQWEWIPVDILVDDFASYADTDALNEVWSAYNSIVELVDGKMVVTSTQDYGQVQIEISRDYSDLESYQMVFATGANNVEFEVSFNVGNEKYPFLDFVGNGKEQTVAFPLDTLQPVGDFQGYIGYIIIKLPAAGTSITVSKVELLVEEKTLEVEGDLEDCMLYNFDALEDDNALAEQFSAEAGTNKTLVEGKDGIGKAMSFYDKVGAYTSVKDWSDYQFIKFDFKTSANNNSFYLQFSDGANYPYVIITGNGKWQTAVVDLDGFSPLNISNVTCLYLTSENNSVIIDNIELLLEGTEFLPEADIEDVVLYSFDSYATDEELQAVMQSNGGTATLADGEDGAKAMSLTDGQVYTNPTFSTWSENHSFLSIKYKTSANNAILTVAMDDWSGEYPYLDLVGNGTWQTAIISLDRFDAINLNNVTTLFLKADDGDIVLIEEIALLIDGTEFLPEADEVEPEA